MSKNAVCYIVKGGSYTQLLAVSLASLIEHYESSEPLDVLIVEDMTIPRDKFLLTSLPELYGKPQIKIKLSPAPSVSASLQTIPVEINEVVLWRLFLPHEFPDYDKILYLDNDTIVYCDVTELFDQLQADDLIAAVPDFFFYVQSDVMDLGHQYGLKTSKTYVNAGVIVFNRALFAATYSVEMILEALRQNTYSWPDQTVLNILCEDRISLLPLAYNYQKNDYWLNSWAKGFSPQSAEEIVAAREAIKIRHFIMYERFSMPWEHLHVDDRYEMDFWNYLHFLKQYVYHRKH